MFTFLSIAGPSLTRLTVLLSRQYWDSALKQPIVSHSFELNSLLVEPYLLIVHTIPDNHLHCTKWHTVQTCPCSLASLMLDLGKSPAVSRHWLATLLLFHLTTYHHHTLFVLHRWFTLFAWKDLQSSDPATSRGAVLMIFLAPADWKENRQQFRWEIMWCAQAGVNLLPVSNNIVCLSLNTLIWSQAVVGARMPPSFWMNAWRLAYTTTNNNSNSNFCVVFKWIV